MSERHPLRIQPGATVTVAEPASKTARNYGFAAGTASRNNTFAAGAASRQANLRLVPDPRVLPPLPWSAPSREQLPLSPAYRAKQASDLRARLLRYLNADLIVSVTDNQAVMLTVRRQPQHRRFTVRVHHVFYDAPDQIISALARYIHTNDPEASRVLNHYIDTQDHRLPDPTPRNATLRAVNLRTMGQVFDLKRLYDSLNDHYFAGSLDARLTWGRYATPGRSRNTIRLASYCYEEDLIRVHPGLDQNWVPRYYLEWVLYHEMLHAHLPAVECNGRRQFHTPEFLGLERQFKHYVAAAEWERNNLPALLRI